MLSAGAKKFIKKTCWAIEGGQLWANKSFLAVTKFLGAMLLLTTC